MISQPVLTGPIRNAQKVYDRAEDLLREAESGRNLSISADQTVQSSWDLGIEQYNGDQDGGRGSREGIKYSTINRTQGAVITDVANSTKNEPKVNISPVDVGDEPIWYVSRKLRTLAQRSIHEETQTQVLKQLDERQLAGFEPIDDELVQLLIAVFETEDVVVKVNDSLVADAIEQVYKKMIRLAKKQMYVNQNQLTSTTVGTGWLNFQYDDKTHRFKYRNWPIRNVWIDSTEEWIDDAKHVQVEILIDVDDLKKEYPKKKEAIHIAAMTGTLENRRANQHEQSQHITNRGIEGDRYIQRLASQFENVEYVREMVVVRIFWERGHDYPMRESEALDEGFVIKKRVVDDELGDSDVFVLLDDEGNELRPITPDDKGWPQINHIRQVVFMPDAPDGILFDGRCPYLDIPLGHNKNIPLINSPYGLGEPFRLYDLQTGANEHLTDLRTHFHNYRYRQQIMPQSLLETFKGEAPYSHPGLVFGLAGEDWDDYMRDRQSFEMPIPDLPNSAVGLFQIYLAELDKTGGNSDVLQGNSPGADSSGRNTLALQAEGKAPIAYKARNQKFMLERLAFIEIDAMVRFLPQIRWEKFLGKYDRGVISAITQKAKSLVYDINVSVSGEDGDEALKLSFLQWAFERGAVDTITLHEMANVIKDPQKVMKRLQQQQAGQIPGGPTPGDLGASAPPPPTNVEGQDNSDPVADNQPNQSPSLTTGEQAAGQAT